MKERADGDLGERGMAMIAAVMCLLVVLTLTTVAIRQSVAGLSSYAQSRKLLQTVDAAEAGIQAEISAVQTWLSSPTLTLPCQGGSSVTGLPSGGWVPAGSASADSVVNAASLGYYSLSLATYTIKPTGPPAMLPASAACYGNSILAPVATSSWYLLVQAKSANSATTGGSTGTGRTLQGLLLVDEPSLISYQHFRGANMQAHGQVELVGFYSGTGNTYTSSASAQAINFSPIVTSQSNASYSGSGPPDANQSASSQPSTTQLTGESWLTAGALGQYAEADSSGSSLACAGLVASPGSVPAGPGDPSCSPSGSPGPTGVKLDLSTIPGVGPAISSIADVTLETSAITSSASMGTGGSPTSGSVSLGSAYIRVAVPLGPTVTIPITLSTAPNQNLMSEVTTAISSDAGAIGPTASTLVSALNATLALTSNYQTTIANTFYVSAVHVSILSGGVTADLALSTVGPNGFTPVTTTTVPPTTTTTTAPPTTTTLPTNDLTVIWIKQVA